MTPPVDARTLLSTLRPQPFGRTSSESARDPIVEPLWLGVRVLAGIDETGASLVDEDGEPVTDQDRVVRALAVAASAESAILDGYLTKQVSHNETAYFTPPPDLTPTAGQTINRMMFGIRRNRADEKVAEMNTAREARTFGPDDPITFMATDLLWLDGESLLDVPLLERKRILESVVIESEVVRLGLYVRPPIEPWIGSWRTQGFTGLTFKAANSRYSPGVASKDWAASPMPRR
jgi:bifunctional non-homologous end joining protein LigD